MAVETGREGWVLGSQRASYENFLMTITPEGGVRAVPGASQAHTGTPVQMENV